MYDLFEIYSELVNVAHNWRDVGRALRLHPGLLDMIEADHSDVKSCLEAVLNKWLRREYDTTCFGQPSWKLLVEAIAHPAGCNDRFLAEQIAAKRSGKFLQQILSYTYTKTHTCVYVAHILLQSNSPWSHSLLLQLNYVSLASDVSTQHCNKCTIHTVSEDVAMRVLGTWMRHVVPAVLLTY